MLLATGGLGHVYSDTTNPAVATGDGVAMAYRAGAEISDMEFVQFHPTALFLKGAPRFLLSEALRGEGAYLRNLELKRFMPKYHEAGGACAARRGGARHRARAGTGEAARRSGLSRPHPSQCRPRAQTLSHDLRHLHAVQHRYRDRAGAHSSGGALLRWAVSAPISDGQTSLPGLYAAGEVACTGVHGANRLASNSLLEGLVYGARAAQTMREQLSHAANKHASREPASRAAEQQRPVGGNREVHQKIQSLMWQHVGVVRDGKALQQVVPELRALQAQAPASAIAARMRRPTFLKLDC